MTESQYQSILRIYEAYHEFEPVKVFEEGISLSTLELLVTNNNIDVLRWIIPSTVKLPVSSHDICNLLLIPEEYTPSITNEVLRITRVSVSCVLRHLITRMCNGEEKKNPGLLPLIINQILRSNSMWGEDISAVQNSVHNIAKYLLMNAEQYHIILVGSESTTIIEDLLLGHHTLSLRIARPQTEIEIRLMIVESLFRFSTVIRAKAAFERHEEYIRRNIQELQKMTFGCLGRFFREVVNISRERQYVATDFYVWILARISPYMDHAVYEFLYKMALAEYISVTECLGILGRQKIILLCLSNPPAPDSSIDDIVRYVDWLIDIGRSRQLTPSFVFNVTKRLMAEDCEESARRLIFSSRLSKYSAEEFVEYYCKSGSPQGAQARSVEVFDLLGEAGFFSSSPMTMMSIFDYLPRESVNYVSRVSFYKSPPLGSRHTTLRTVVSLLQTLPLVTARKVFNQVALITKEDSLTLYAPLIMAYLLRVDESVESNSPCGPWAEAVMKMLDTGLLHWAGIFSSSPSIVSEVTQILCRFGGPRLLQLFHESYRYILPSGECKAALILSARQAFEIISRSALSSRLNNVVYGHCADIVALLGEEMVIDDKILTLLSRHEDLSQLLGDSILAEISRRNDDNLRPLADRCLSIYLSDSVKSRTIRDLLTRHQDFIGEVSASRMLNNLHRFNWAELMGPQSRIKLSGYFSSNLRDYLLVIISLFHSEYWTELRDLLSIPTIISGKVRVSSERKKLHLGEHDYSNFPSSRPVMRAITSLADRCRSIILQDEVIAPVKIPQCESCKKDLNSVLLYTDSQDTFGKYYCRECGESKLTRQCVTCPVCMEDSGLAILGCGHACCDGCLANIADGSTREDGPPCPTCRVPIGSAKLIITRFTAEEVVDKFLSAAAR